VYDDKVRKVYENMFNVLYHKFHDHNRAWDNLVEFLAVDNCPPMLLQMDHQFEWFYEDKKLAEELIAAYDMDLIKSDRHDHLGDLYVENQSRLSQSYKGQFLTPDNVVELMVQMTIPKTEDEINILEPAVGTGRFLLAANKYAPNANLFGVDIDIRAIRIAFTNCAIHNVSAYLLCADSLQHETYLHAPEGRYNWGFANRWHSCWDQLKEIGADRESVSVVDMEPMPGLNPDGRTQVTLDKF